MSFFNIFTIKNSIFSGSITIKHVMCICEGNGMPGITDVTSMVTFYFDPVTKFIYAIGAVVGLIAR